MANVITTRRDLDTYAHSCTGDAEVARRFAELLADADGAPRYGSDWSEWLDENADALFAQANEGPWDVYEAEHMDAKQAIAALVDQDCARWGEQERGASARAHARRSIGLALNELANRAELYEGEAWLGAHTDATTLRAAAKRELTAADRYALSKGG